MGMYKIDNNMLSEVHSIKFKDFEHSEKDIQRLVKQNPLVLGEDLFIISEEYQDWQESRKRLDLLAIDPNGNLVVIEFKRDNDGFHMDLQAIRYAAMLSLMSYENVAETYAKYSQQSIEEVKKQINSFLYTDDENFEFGRDIRIILINNSFSKELTSSVLWLRKKGIDIKCIQITSYKNGNDILLDIDTLIPLKEANEYMIAIEKKEKEREKVQNEIQNTRDYTKYIFNGKSFAKNRLVLEVVRQFAKENNGMNYEKLKSVFPDQLQGSLGVFQKLEDTQRYSSSRFFDKENEVITLAENVIIAVCTQWSKDNFKIFLDKALSLNFDIKSE